MGSNLRYEGMRRFVASAKEEKMAKMIFVNLPVRDLTASTAFYVALGGEVSVQFSDEQAFGSALQANKSPSRSQGSTSLSQSPSIARNRVKIGGVVLSQSHQTWPQHEGPWDFFRCSASGWASLFCKILQGDRFRGHKGCR